LVPPAARGELRLPMVRARGVDNIEFVLVLGALVHRHEKWVDKLEAFQVTMRAARSVAT
jgi:hypothetical protein